MKRPRNYEKVLDHIRLNLSDGSLKPGERMWTVSALSEQLGVGQASVREAYRILELMGVLEVTQGRGTFITIDYSNSQYDFINLKQAPPLEIIEARLIIEPQIAALAAKRATDLEIQGLFDSIAVLESQYWQGLDCTNEAIAFHGLLLRAAHNPTLLHLVSAILEFDPPEWQMPSNQSNEFGKMIALYRLIAHSIKDRNPRAARYLMYKHLHDMQRSLQKGEDKIANEYEQFFVEITPL